MIVLDGLPALSAFRLERLNRELNRSLPRAKVVAAWQVYFVAPNEGEAAPVTARLAQVLRASVDAPKPATLWIVPRLGTISPWSSKATDILHGCGFPVRRVEHAVAFAVDNAPAADTSDFDLLARALHDPMTQSVLSS